MGAAGTSLLTLMAARTDARRRAPAATILWLMMILGIVVTSATASTLLDPFSPARLVAVTAGVAVMAFALAVLAVWGIEGPTRGTAPPPARADKGRFGQAMREVWAEPQSRRFAVFVFVSMLAYSAQEVVLEPFAGAVFHLTPGQTAGLTGLQHGGVLAGMACVALACLCAGEFRSVPCAPGRWAAASPPPWRWRPWQPPRWWDRPGRCASPCWRWGLPTAPSPSPPSAP